MSEQLSRATAQSTQGDFWKFWAGQTISNFGTAFTDFALPLLIFHLTGSPLTLGITVITEVLPYLLFGLLIGAWVDRVNRKRLMICTDLARALVIALIPLLARLGILNVWWIYAVAFVSSTLSIGFVTAQFAAIPSLVHREEPVTANGRIQASFSTVSVLGPLIGGVLVAFLPLPALLLFDAVSYLISAGSLALITRSFNAATDQQKAPTSIRADLLEGLRYVLRHPIIRNTTLMVGLVNVVSVMASAQLVLFARRWLSASDPQVGWLYAAGGIGVVLFSLAAGPLRKRWSYSVIILGSMMLEGLSITALALTHLYWAALPIWALNSGMANLFTIASLSLIQLIVPNELLGRVRSAVRVLAWSAIPAGSLLGSVAIQQTQNVGLVYAVCGLLVFLIPLAFAFTALGHAERYLPQEQEPPALTAERAS